MKRYRNFSLPMISLVLFLLPFAVGADGVGVVKGTVTIGGKPAADAVVSVEGLPEATWKTMNSKAGAQPALIDQRELKFIPRVLPVLVGTSVNFPNNDKTWHNVYSKSEAKEFDLGLYPAGQTRSVAFDKPGVVRILCNVHPNMEAFVVVMEHHYFTTLDKRGNYRLDQVPLGQYQIKIWHPEFEPNPIPFNLVRQGEVLIINVDLEKK